MGQYASTPEEVTSTRDKTNTKTTRTRNCSVPVRYRDADESSPKHNNNKDFGGNDIDVLTGYKRSHNHALRYHPGNQRYHTILEKYSTEYQNADVGGTTRKQILQQALQEIQSNGARFMTNKNHSRRWVEMKSANVRRKLSDSLLRKPGIISPDVPVDNDNCEEEACHNGNNNNDYFDEDILSGHTFRTHPGNQRFRAIVERYATQYQNTAKGPDRKAMLQHVVNEIESNGGRFMKMKKKTTQWVEMKPYDIRQKVSISLLHGLRKPPGENDVLFHDDDDDTVSRKNTIHPGNERYHAIVEQYSTKYQRAKTEGFTQKQVLQQMLDEIQSNGARFMAHNRHNDTWVEMTTDMVRKQLKDTIQDAFCINPQENDILIGGSVAENKSHSGNQRFRTIVEKYCAEYVQAEKGGPERKALILQMLDEIQSKGARFLVNVNSRNNKWVEMEAKKVRNKLCISLQNKARTLKQQQQRVGDEEVDEDEDEDEDETDESDGEEQEEEDETDESDGEEQEEKTHTLRHPRQVDEEVEEDETDESEEVEEDETDESDDEEQENIRNKLSISLQNKARILRQPRQVDEDETDESDDEEQQEEEEDETDESDDEEQEDEEEEEDETDESFDEEQKGETDENDEEGGNGNNGILESDILSRSKKRFPFHPGNQRYNAILEKYIAKYQAAKPLAPARFAILLRVLEEIQSNGARFMTYNEQINAWGEMDYYEYRKKVSDALRRNKMTRHVNKGSARTGFRQQQEEEEEETEEDNNERKEESNDVWENDILSWGNKRFTLHPGNQRYCAILEKYHKKYHTAIALGQNRILIVRSVIKETKSYGARFMTYNEYNDTWVKMKKDIIERKVADALRKDRPKKSVRTQQVTNICNTRSVPQRRQQVEDDDKSAVNYDDTFTKKDILIAGAGCGAYLRSISPHPGNQRYHAILERHAAIYQSVERGPTRRRLLQEALEEILSNGARFMTNRDGIGNSWVEMDTFKVERKVNDALLLPKPASTSSSDMEEEQEQEMDKVFNKEEEEPIEDDSKEEEEDYNDYNEKDILSGDKSIRRLFRRYPGNQRFYAILEKYAARYQNLKGESIRQNMEQQALEEIQSNGARFMMFKNHGNYWVEMETSRARKKVCQVLSKFKSTCTNNGHQEDQKKDENHDDVKGAAKAASTLTSNSYCDEDILCGNLPGGHRHPGLERYRRIIVQHHLEFRRAEVRDKQEFITQDVLKKIKSRGGRFVKPIVWKVKGGETIWVELDADQAFIKVFKALRACQGKINAGQDINDKKIAKLQYEVSTTAATNTSIDSANREVEGQHISFGISDDRKERDSPSATQQVTDKYQAPRPKETDKEGIHTVTPQERMNGLQPLREHELPETETKMCNPKQKRLIGGNLKPPPPPNPFIASAARNEIDNDSDSTTSDDKKRKAEHKTSLATATRNRDAEPRETRDDRVPLQPHKRQRTRNEEPTSPSSERMSDTASVESDSNPDADYSFLQTIWKNPSIKFFEWN